MPKRNKPGKPSGHGNTCPECGAELQVAPFPYCPACSMNFINCPSCNANYSRDLDNCPECGAESRKPMIGI